MDGLTGMREPAAVRRRPAPRDRARGTSRPTLTLVLADLDNFKSVNDEHGHDVGDDVLRAFAASSTQTVRDVDLAGRGGGEEFLAPPAGDRRRGPTSFAERVRTRSPSARSSVARGT